MLSEIKKIYIIQRKDIWFAFSKEQYGEMKDDVEGTRWCLYKSTMKDVLFFYELLQKSGWNIKKYAKKKKENICIFTYCETSGLKLKQ